MGRKHVGRRLDGWLVLDKPAGMTSATALGKALKMTGAAKAGHAGTLDPLATGVLPLAFGQATRTVAFVMGGAKRYRVTIRWGESRTTDDADGDVIDRNPVRPGAAAILAALPVFHGTISQTPPRYAAVKRDGERAYAIARRGEDPELEPREVRVDGIVLAAGDDPDLATLEIDCGKGFYVRALARDLAQHLGTLGHVVALRRLRVGPFHEAAAISLDRLDLLVHSPAFVEHLLPIETALADIPALPISEEAALRLSRGASVKMPGNGEGPVRVTAAGKLLALGKLVGGEIRPVRVFNQ